MLLNFLLRVYIILKIIIIDKGEILLTAKANLLNNDQNEKKIEILISVKDEGIGISENAKSKIFQPFTQAGKFFF